MKEFKPILIMSIILCTYLVPEVNVVGLQLQVVLSYFILNVALHLGHSQPRSKHLQDGNVTPVALGGDELPLDLFC